MNYLLRVYVPGLLLGSYCLYLAVSHGYWPFVLVAWALISGLGIAVGFHRVYSHKTHKLQSWLDNLLLFLGTIGGQGSSITWVAVHRGYHHRHSDKEQDLHSPTHGFFHSLFLWYWKIKPETIQHKFAVDLFRRPNHLWVHKHYFKLLGAWVIFLCGVSYLTRLPIIDVYLAALALSLIQDNLVNSLCHQPTLGYRNWRLQDNSTNFWPLGYFGWGQGWHENHHAYPAKFNFGHRWWEFDPCVLFLPLLKLGSKR